MSHIEDNAQDEIEAYNDPWLDNPSVNTHLDFDSFFFQTENKLCWYHYFIHLGYYIPYWLKFFFSKPFKEEKRDLNLLEQVNSLLDVSATNENIEKCKELVHLHRIVENTKARRRLEKWSLRVIAIYLFIVLGIVCCNYMYVPLFSGLANIQITEPIMITILSTTTVNIIGLGLIVLRGHFLANDKSNDIKKEKP